MEISSRVSDLTKCILSKCHDITARQCWKRSSIERSLKCLKLLIFYRCEVICSISYNYILDLAGSRVLKVHCLHNVMRLGTGRYHRILLTELQLIGRVRFLLWKAIIIHIPWHHREWKHFIPWLYKKDKFCYANNIVRAQKYTWISRSDNLISSSDNQVAELTWLTEVVRFS